MVFSEVFRFLAGLGDLLAAKKADKELVRQAFNGVLITKCPIYNLFYKNVLMLYNEYMAGESFLASELTPHIISVQNTEYVSLRRWGTQR